MIQNLAVLSNHLRLLPLLPHKSVAVTYCFEGCCYKALLRFFNNITTLKSRPITCRPGPGLPWFHHPFSSYYLLLLPNATFNLNEDSMTMTRTTSIRHPSALSSPSLSSPVLRLPPRWPAHPAVVAFGSYSLKLVAYHHHDDKADR